MTICLRAREIDVFLKPRKSSKLKIAFFLQNLDKFGLKLLAVYKSNANLDRRITGLTKTPIRPNYDKRILCACNPKSKNDVLEQICWNNKFITSDRKSIYYPLWRLAGICKIKDLVDTQQKCFLSFDSFCNKFNVRCNFLQYFGLVNAIPQSWKKLLDSAGEQGSTSQIIIDEITCKEIYTMLLSLQPTPPPTCEKRLLNSSKPLFN